MPRILDYRVRLTAERRASAGRYQVRGYKRWVDPFPHVIGTVPEKYVYAQLSFRGIPFWFQNQVNFNIPELKLFKSYRPDFVIPSLKLIIEVQGSYFHSMPKTIEEDAFKFAVYEQTGWKVVSWWDYDILRDVNMLFVREPLLARYAVKYNKSSETTNGKKVVRDDTKGIATLNYRRAQRLQYKKQPIARKIKAKTKSYGRYVSGR